MKWIGLTGGISVGKSTVTKILRTLGYEVLDADEFSRQVTAQNGEALPAIFKTFGQELRNPDGSLNREALGAQVFGQAELMRKLEAIIHPLVQQKVSAAKAKLNQQGATIVFYDVPLLFEKNMQSSFDAVVLVYCTEEQQIKRLMDRNSLSQEEAVKRIRSQMPLEIKKAQTNYVIDNSKDLKHLEAEVQRVLMLL